jgi:hypothetical protein
MLDIISRSLACAVLLLVGAPSVWAQDSNPDPPPREQNQRRPNLGGPDQVDNLLEEDAKPKKPLFSLAFLDPYFDLKQRVKEKTGLSFAVDCSPALGQVSAISASPTSKRKADSAQKAFKDYVENVKKYLPKLGFQSDCVGMPLACDAQTDHQIYLGAEFFGNHYWLKALTSVNGEILKLSGEVRDPYLEGKLGVIEEGAYADILLVDGNPLEDITVIGGNEKWFDAEPRPFGKGIDTMRIIIKDGEIYKNTL